MDLKVFKISLKASDIIMEQGETWAISISAQFIFEYIEAMWGEITALYAVIIKVNIRISGFTRI